MITRRIVSSRFVYKSGEAPRASSGESSEDKKLNAPKEAPSSNPRAKFDKKAQFQEANRIKEFESELTDIAAKSGVNAIVLRKLQPGDKPHISADLLPLKVKIMDALQVVNSVITPEQSHYLKGVTVVLDPFNPDYHATFPAKTIMLNDCSSRSIADMAKIIAGIFQYHENSTVSTVKKQAQKYTLEIPSLKGALDEFGRGEQIRIANETISRSNSAAYNLDIKYEKEALRKLESELSPQDKKKIAITKLLATRLLNREFAAGAWISHSGFKLDPSFPGCLVAKISLDLDPDNRAESGQTLMKAKDSLRENEDSLLKFVPPLQVVINYSLLDLKDLEKWSNGKLTAAELVYKLRSSKNYPAFKAWKASVDKK